MPLRAGIPLISDVDALLQDDLFRQHSEYNSRFLAKHGPALRGYGRHWGENPLGLWSRRWEYPFVGQRMVDFGRQQTGAIKILDAGSGVTYFDYLLCDELPSAQVVCCDYDTSYTPMFAAINQNTPNSRVSFMQASLQSLPLEAGSIDAICCISVLEHTNRYGEILDEFIRVLRPGGVLVLTFDLSLDGRFDVPRPQAQALLEAIEARFAIEPGLNAVGELARMDQKDVILSTDYVKRTNPELLPWRYPLLKGLYDLIKGKGWSGGFHSKSVYCLEARRRA